MKRVTTHSLTRAVAMALACGAPLLLAACGGGGGGNGTPEQAPPPPPAQQVPPPPTTPLQTTTYSPYVNQLLPTGVTAAQEAGFTGKGVRVGVMDSGVNPSDPALTGKVAWFKSYISGGSQTENDDYGHGSMVSDLIAGDQVPSYTYQGTSYRYAGGVAPDAKLYEAQVCTSGDACETIPQAYTDLAAQGVHIVNESFDGGDITTTNAGSMSGEDANMQIAANDDMLQVVSAGNDGYKNVGYGAGIPYYYPSLQPYIIAAVNVNLDSKGNVTGLWSGSNAPSDACGVAANWCLAAPGLVIGLPQPPDLTTGAAVGTSGSAAVISGVAALVEQAYPWMTAPNLQDTLLTTATHLQDNGNSGVTAGYTPGTVYTPNATYGWGLVDAGRAVHGPGEFTSAFDASVGGDQSTFGNVISGPGSLVLSGTGSGSLTLSKDNTYTGGTTINSGTLIVSGSVASMVTLNGGSLAGTGTIKANVANTAGTVVSQGSKAGEGLTITGNLTDGASSTTAVALGDPLHVGGTASLNGALGVLDPPAGYTVKTTEPMLYANAVSGTFTSTTFPAFYVGSATYGAKEVDVTLTQMPVASVVASSPLASQQTLSTASHLDRALNVSNRWYEQGQAGHRAWFQTAGQVLDTPTVAEAVSEVNSLSGEIYADSCVFRSMPATSSGVCRAKIPVHVGPAFRSMPAGVNEAG